MLVTGLFLYIICFYGIFLSAWICFAATENSQWVRLECHSLSLSINTSLSLALSVLSGNFGFKRSARKGCICDETSFPILVTLRTIFLHLTFTQILHLCLFPPDVSTMKYNIICMHTVLAFIGLSCTNCKATKHSMIYTRNAKKPTVQLKKKMVFEFFLVLKY